MRQAGAGSTLVLKKKVTSSLSKEQEARQWIDLMIQAQYRTNKRKSLKVPQPEGQEPRYDRPLNVLGCFALINTLRSMETAERSRIGTRTDA
jgi:hypothetical protein